MKYIDTLVIGAGPGGYVAAIRASQMKQNVTIVEREYLGGVCSNVGCIPSKVLISVGHRFEQAKHSDDMGVVAQGIKLDWTKVQEFKKGVVSKLVGGVESLLKGNKIDIVKGEASFIDANTVRVIDGDNSQTYTFKNAVLATGSRPVEIPTFKFTERVINSTGALSLLEVPQKLVVIGGGYIGTELGSAYANLGSQVTIIEGGKDILAGFEKQMTQVVKKGLKKKGVEVIVGASAKGVEENENGVVVTYEAGGEEKTVEANYVLVTVGRRPNTDEMGLEAVGIKFAERGLLKVDKQCRTSVPNIYAIGDIISGPQLAHKASYEGKVAAEAIAGEKSIVDYLAIPAVCFTDPELATVGYNEKQAKAEGIEVKVAKFPFAANGRTLTLNTAEGFVKLVVRKKDEVLIGAQIVGDGASDMIAEMGLAIETGMTAKDISLTLHAHPTLGEITREAAEVIIGRPTHIMKA
ncbi:dihydrolipoyl dehydrogenase [Lysinibacillus sp. FSL M8-0216]|uniref:Dihydrolipoyl dehydrogenase n=1 Tax=Lysinibacillus fusiformis TaxID=28031 RepID=A0A1H9RYV4_9BACI|nr:dihydrolipoyl dehydrogenase [Lysinibacillus fusiformis]MCG7435252.1 dihydrolipoyl dehydrogenase [Lysinibacillus fusiformis]SCX62526.1 dihydrolipoamide dehydrogenase [Lysinibacillus fusiformis]SCY80571.1 dihydrolipoamide dehydrogenase [Lysinibacillus fusiformis]SDB43648.1 dihydrolipoamide dehydrogenase [Lysinibacillus fusiformis]SEO48024.1 dihydrolipoamide dehydrogenase [Lysinibacillus fusiformis]